MVLEIVGGIALLFVGGELLVRGASGLARRMGISPLLIGIVIVGFGTSTPELVTSVEAAMRHSPGIAVGNVVGSNISNLLLILGLVALISPVPIERARFVRDALFLIGSAGILAYVAPRFELDVTIGGIFLALLALYLVVAYATEPRTRQSGDGPAGGNAAIGLLILVAGLAGTIYGAKILVDGSLKLARDFGISETVIGVTIVAVGTSVPELAVSLIAVARRSGEIAVGNIIGSNVYNTFGILGVTGFISPFAFPAEIVAFDMWVMLGATVAAVAFAASRSRVSRLEGFLMLLAYGAYIGVLATVRLTGG